MIGNSIVSLILVVVAIACVVFNKRLANRMADKYAKVLPSPLTPGRSLVTTYRVLFYFFSFFCVVIVFLVLSSLIQ
jgi:hypothetical protein